MIPPASVNLAALRARKSLAIDTEPHTGLIAQIEGTPAAYSPNVGAFPATVINLADGPTSVSSHANTVAKYLHGTGAMAHSAAMVDQYSLMPWLTSWLFASIIPTPAPHWHTAPPIVACCAFALDGNTNFTNAVSNRIAWITQRHRVQVVTGTPPIHYPGRTIPSSCPEAIVAGVAGQVCDFTVPGVSLSSWATPIVAGAYYLLWRESRKYAAPLEAIRACMLAGRREDRSLDIDAADKVLAGCEILCETTPTSGWCMGDDRLPGTGTVTIKTTQPGTLHIAVVWSRPTTETEGADGKIIVHAHESVVAVNVDGMVHATMDRPGVESRHVEAGEHRIVVATGLAHPFALAWRFEPDDSPATPPSDGATLGGLLNAWGTDCPTHDLNQDGTVDGADLGIMLDNWNPDQGSNT